MHHLGIVGKVDLGDQGPVTWSSYRGGVEGEKSHANQPIISDCSLLIKYHFDRIFVSLSW